VNPTDALIVLQARMGSTRLPGKSLRTIGERSILARCVERLLAGRAAPLLLATTMQPEDDALVEEASRFGVPVVRGSADDVLGRFGPGSKGMMAAEIHPETGPSALSSH